MGEVRKDYPNLTVIPPAGWESGLIYNDGKKALRSKSYKNALLFLENHADTAGGFAYNSLTYMPEILRPMPWDKTEKECPRTIDESDCIYAAAWLETNGVHGFSGATVWQIMCAIASECQYNPLVDYLRSLEWDGHERVYRWL